MLTSWHDKTSEIEVWIDELELPTLDLKATPRGLAPFYGESPGISLSGSSWHVSSSTGRRGQASPKKREVQLRQADAFPLQREAIEMLAEPSTLMRDLAALRLSPVIPDWLKDRVTSQCGWANPPADAWFYPAMPNDSDDYLYRRLDTIRRRTIKCKQTMEHEVGWNEGVHWPLLDAALGDGQVRHVDYRNVTHCPIYPEFRDRSPLLNDARVDYAIVLEPPVDSGLGRALRRRAQHRVTHVQLSDEADTPVAIGIETKSSNANGSVVGPAQLATWARAHFRHLESLPAADADNLPVLPLVLVQGAEWRVDFAQRRPARLIIWHELTIGSSDTLRGCYHIVTALRRLAQWSCSDLMPWWEQALGGEVDSC